MTCRRWTLVVEEEEVAVEMAVAARRLRLTGVAVERRRLLAAVRQWIGELRVVMEEAVTRVKRLKWTGAAVVVVEEAMEAVRPSKSTGVR